MGHLPVASEFMVTQVVTASPEDDAWEAIELLLGHGITGAPVVVAGHEYRGVFSEKSSMELLAGDDPAAEEVRELLRAQPAVPVAAQQLFTLRPELDVFEAIQALLQRRVSGAPVVDADGRFVGSFSEKTSMSVLLAAAQENLPSNEVRAFMDPDRGRVIDEGTDLLEVARTFLTTPYRRLPIVRDHAVVGQISRRDVLRRGVPLGRQHWGGAAPKVAELADTEARTIFPDADSLTIASIFRTSPYRRLPVLSGQQLVGLVTRSDVIRAMLGAIGEAVPKQAEPLYLSAFEGRDRDAAGV